MLTSFRHASDIWREYPELSAGALLVDDITAEAPVEAALDRYASIANARLSTSPESELPEIQAWRRAFTRMGLKPTQYRCAAESLLRRFRKERSLPRIHPLIDLCNAVSIAFAIPVAVFDRHEIEGDLTVRFAAGHETYQTFGGEEEHPAPHEVVFADSADRAHARRWTNRQSGFSAVSGDTSAVLVVAEAMHAEGGADVPRLLAALESELVSSWSVEPRSQVLTPAAPVITA